MAKAAPANMMDRFVLPALLAGCLILQYSFQQLMLPGGLPVGEVVLAIYLLTTNLGLLFAELSSVVTITPFLVWWLHCIGYAMLCTPEEGLWALRDASQALDSLFIIVGFNYARKAENIERLLHFLVIVLFGATIYGVTVSPFATEVAAMSPQLTAANGKSVPLIGAFGNFGDILLWAAIYLAVAKPLRMASLNSIASGAIIGFVVLLFQNRTTYLQIIAMMLLLGFLRPRSIAPLLSFVPIVALVIPLISASGIQISGRLTSEISLSFLLEHFGAIFGVSDGNKAVAGAAAGVDQRLGWWTDLYRRVTADPITFMTGLGYGFPLIAFKDIGDITVREPHNSIVSIFARAGFIGLVAWVAMHLEMLVCTIKTFFSARSAADLGEWENTILFLFTFNVLVIVRAIGEDRLEKTFNAIPYYFFWGLLLGVAHWRFRANAFSASHPAATRFASDAPKLAY